MRKSYTTLTDGKFTGSKVAKEVVPRLHGWAQPKGWLIITHAIEAAAIAKLQVLLEDYFKFFYLPDGLRADFAMKCRKTGKIYGCQMKTETAQHYEDLRADTRFNISRADVAAEGWYGDLIVFGALIREPLSTQAEVIRSR